MVPIPRLKALAFACVFFNLISTAEAIQWPVNGGPVHQPVPQYRAGYPLFDPQPKLQPEESKTHRSRELRHAPESPLTEPNAPSRRETEAPPAQLPEPSPVPHQEVGPREPAAAAATETGANQAGRYQLNPSPDSLERQLAKKPAAKKKKPNPPTTNYDIYRDRNPLPIDPRKPCGICTNPTGATGCGPLCDAPGLHGKPFQEQEPGGCRCGDKNCGSCKPMFSHYWPRPFSAKLDEPFPTKAAARYSPFQKTRLVDAFNKFVDFKLIEYHRKDNGYCGKDSDPYGCLSENRMIASGVAGVGYRFPSVPIDRSAGRQSFRY